MVNEYGFCSVQFVMDGLLTELTVGLDDMMIIEAGRVDVSVDQSTTVVSCVDGTGQVRS